MFVSCKLGTSNARAWTLHCNVGKMVAMEGLTSMKIVA
jgi:hypothetical protein